MAFKKYLHRPWQDAEWVEENLARHGGNVSALARELGISRANLRHAVEKHKHAARPVHPPLVPILAEPVRLSGDVACTSDWHVPITDYDLFTRFIESVEAYNLDTIICAGDLFNLDAMSRYPAKQAGAGFTPEREHAAYCCKLALANGRRLIITLGNHDERFQAKLEYNARFAEAMRMVLGDLLADDELSRITITDYDHVIVDTDEGEWRICHTKQYSRDPLKVPAKLSMRFGQHVAGGHRHHHALGFAPNGKRVCEMGGFFDETRTEYIKKYSTDFPMWQPGWGLLLGGKMLCPMLS